MTLSNLPGSEVSIVRARRRLPEQEPEADGDAPDDGKWHPYRPDGAALTCPFLELRDPYFTVLENGPEFQAATHGFHVVGKRTDADIGAVLDLRNLALMDAEDFGDL
jgi:hypothetical protein